MVGIVEWARENKEQAREHADYAVLSRINGRVEEALCHEAMAKALIRTVDCLERMSAS